MSFSALAPSWQYHSLSADPWTADAAPIVTDALRYPDISEQLFPAGINNTEQSGQNWIQQVLDRTWAHHWMLSGADGIYGDLNVSKSEQSEHALSLGYWLHPHYYGRGLARAAVYYLCRVLLPASPYRLVQALIEPKNQASCRVVLGNGFVDMGMSPGGYAQGNNTVEVIRFERNIPIADRLVV